MIGRTNAFPIGGGTSPIDSYIAVTYPLGSVCTCTNGTKTFRGGDTAGAIVFSLPSEGDWTVSCTNGSRTSSKVVSVSSNNVYTIDLVYELRLYYYGDECTDITGGWDFYRSTATWDSSEKRVDNLYLTSTLAASGGSLAVMFETKNSVNLSEYSTIIIRTKEYITFDKTQEARLDVFPTKRTSPDFSSYSTGVGIANTDAEHETILDIENITSSQYVATSLWASRQGGSHSSAMSVYSVIAYP